MSRSQKTAAAKAAAAGRAPSSPAAPRPVIVPEGEINPGIALSPAAATLKPDDVVAAFLGKPVAAEVASTEGETTAQEEETPAETGETQAGETETETQAEDEGETPPEAETETGTEHGTASPLAGIEKALKAKAVPEGIIKRTLEVFQQKTELAERVKQLEGRPATVLSPSATDPLSHAATEADVEAAVTSAKADARSKLRWLNRHIDGGVWAQGTEAEQEFSAAQVDGLIEHYEAISDNADKTGEARKQYLRDYAATVEKLEIPATDLVNPKVPTRESKLIRAVPEIMKTPDYLQVLADAKAWRDIREKKAAGVQFVEIDPKKSKTGAAATTAGKGEVKPKPVTSSNARQPAAPSAEAALTLSQLREKAASGSQSAQAEIARRFMAPV